MNKISIEKILRAREIIGESVMRTPLIPLPLEGLGDHLPSEIWLKLENLQPIGSFKLRGASHAMAVAGPEKLKHGVFTASAGNMAQGVAWNARRLGIQCSVVVPDHAPKVKLEAIERLGAKLVKIPFDEWWQVILTHEYPALEGYFIHPVASPEVIAGNATIGLEILEDLPDVESIIVPFGGGGLSCGIASALAARKPSVRVYACEVESAAPLSASLRAGRPTSIDYRASFVDGIGGKGVLPEMWPLVQDLLEASIVVTPEAIAAAIRLLVQRCRIIAEGAGACSLAAAMGGEAGSGKLVCVISGGNIDTQVLRAILDGETP